MKEPLVSVIIPCYNYGNFLHEALDGILLQTYPYWECIVVDDGSVDNTRDIVESYIRRDSRYRYIYQENKGDPVAKNAGIRHCKGDYLQFLDADDLIEKRKIELHVKFLENHEDVDISYGPARYFSTGNSNYGLFNIYAKKGIEYNPWMRELSGKGMDIIKAFLEGAVGFMAVSSPLSRTKFIKKVGLFDEDLLLIQDWYMWIMCAIKGAYFQFLDYPDTFTLIRLHHSNLSGNLWDRFYFSLVARNKIKRFLGNSELNNINDKCITGILTMLNIEALKILKRKKEEGIKKLKQVYSYKSLTWLEIIIMNIRSIIFIIGLRTRLKNLFGVS